MGLSALTDREYAHVRKRIDQLVADGRDIHAAARIALVEIGVHYWVKATLRGVIRSAAGSGRPNTRALRSFERALEEANKVADPVRKLLAKYNMETPEELDYAVAAYQQGQRHKPEDLLETAAMLVDDAMKSDPEARERFARRWGFHVGEEHVQGSEG